MCIDVMHPRDGGVTTKYSRGTSRGDGCGGGDEGREG